MNRDPGLTRNRCVVCVRVRFQRTRPIAPGTHTHTHTHRVGARDGGSEGRDQGGRRPRGVVHKYFTTLFGLMRTLWYILLGRKAAILVIPRQTIVQTTHTRVAGNIDKQKQVARSKALIKTLSEIKTLI